MKHIPFWQAVRFLAVKYLHDRCLMYASALSFACLLSIVPFFAIVFTVLKALDLHNQLAPAILLHVTAGSHEVISYIQHFISNTQLGSLGMIGFLALVVSVVSVFETIEEVFNQIWRLDRGKRIRHKLRDYLVFIFVIPLMIALTVSITTSLQHQNLVIWFFSLPGFGHLQLLLFRLIPYISIWIALLSLYLFLPNTRVKLRYALVGAFLAGTFWQLAQWAYIYFQFGVSRYNTIYGALALLPVLMIWIYTSWIIILAGMELVWYLQEGKNSGRHFSKQNTKNSYISNIP